VKHVAQLGCLGPRTLLAHAIWLDEDDIRLLADADAGLAYTPIADAHYAVGVLRLDELLDAGVRVGLGVDGANTNNGQDLWETAKMAIFFQKQRIQDTGVQSTEPTRALV